MGLVVIVGGGGDDHDIRLGVGRPGLAGGEKAAGATREVALDEGVRDGGDAGVYLVDAPGVDVDGGDVVVLREQAGERESDVAESSDGDVH